mmetsp:Transcript_73682/g.163762  ORF Transcript_73682/g.163762 Transcript_73682/m.163762 type:complete len:212 (-) Transcript_73682:329-964(-)
MERSPTSHFTASHIAGTHFFLCETRRQPLASIHHVASEQVLAPRPQLLAIVIIALTRWLLEEKALSHSRHDAQVWLGSVLLCVVPHLTAGVLYQFELLPPVISQKEARSAVIEATIHVNVDREHAHLSNGIEPPLLRAAADICLVAVAEKAVTSTILCQPPAFVESVRLPFPLSVRIVIPPERSFLSLIIRFAQRDRAWYQGSNPFPDDSG